MRNWADVLPDRVAMSQTAYDRYRAAKRMREVGLTFKEMGQWFGVSTPRARSILLVGANRWEGRASPIEEYFADAPAYTPRERASFRKCLKS